MSGEYNLCIIKPNKNAFSETFITEHINRLKGNKTVIYGGSFPVYDDQDHYLIRNKIKLIIYLIQKRLFKSQNIAVRNQALVNYLKRKKIDVVFAEYGTVGAMVTQACKIAGVPLVVHFHGADAHHKQTADKHFKLYKHLFEYASAIVVVSHDMAQALINLGAPKNKIYWNPYGVDTEKFPLVDVLHSPPNFITVGRFVAKKSPASVIQAFKLLVSEVPEAKLWMVGTGPLYNSAVQLANDLKLADKITFTGILSQAEIQQLMQTMRCFVQHSVTSGEGDMEGTPNTILEASAAGLAIVSTQHAGIKEAVINYETGYLVPEHNFKMMATYMIKLAQDATLARDLGIKARDHIKNNYDINYRITLLDNIIENTIKKHPDHN